MAVPGSGLDRSKRIIPQYDSVSSRRVNKIDASPLASPTAGAGAMAPPTVSSTLMPPPAISSASLGAPTAAMGGAGDMGGEDMLPPPPTSPDPLAIRQAQGSGAGVGDAEAQQIVRMLLGR